MCVCVCVPTVSGIGFDSLTFLRGGEARSHIVIITAVIITATLGAAVGAAGTHGDNVSSGWRETSHHTWSKEGARRREHAQKKKKNTSR